MDQRTRRIYDREVAKWHRGEVAGPAATERQCNIQIKQIYQIKANPVIRIRIRPKVLLFDSYLYRVGHIRICIREFLFVWHCTTLLICIRICLFYLFQFSINKKKIAKKTCQW